MDTYISKELDAFIPGMVAWGDHTTESIKELYKEIKATYQTGKWKTVRECHINIIDSVGCGN